MNLSLNSLQEYIKNKLKMLNSEDKKYSKLVLYLTLFGFVLRFFAARNLDVLADDMVYASQSAGIISSGIISTHSNPPLFFYLTDLAYQIFGYTTLASRLLPLIAGTLLIPLTYLISKDLLKDSKSSFFAALFVAISSFLVKMTFTEQSLVVLFFIFSGVYIGLLFLKNPKYPTLLLSSSMFGIALLTKYSAPFFIISFVIYSLYTIKSGNIRNIKLKHILVFAGILLLFSMPFLSFNYLIYKQKGIVDVYFSRLVHLNSTQELYAGLGGQENSFIDNLLNIRNYQNYKLPFFTDTILVIFAFFGIYKIFKNDKKVFYFTLIFLAIPFVLQSAGAPLEKHFAFMYILLAIPAGLGLGETMRLSGNRKYLKIGIFTVMGLFLLFSLSVPRGTPPSYFTQSPTSQLKTLINEEVEQGSLLVFDSRIYTARSVWLATDHAYVNPEQAIQIFNQIFEQKIPSSERTSVYFVECVIEDCGWGWVSTNQELNRSAENFVSAISSSSDIINEIQENNREYYRVYKTNMNIPKSYLEQIKKSQTFYFVPYLYLNLENYLFSYKTVDPFSKLLVNSSRIVIILSMLVTLLSFILIGFLLFSKPRRS